MEAEQYAEDQRVMTETLERRAVAFQCRLDALNQEMLWRFGQTVEQCEESPGCHPADPESADWIVRENKIVLNEITERKEAAGRVFDSGGELDGRDYGPHIGQERAADIAITNEVVNKSPSDQVCYITSTSASFWTLVIGREGETVRHRWLYGDAQQEEVPLIFTSEHRVGSDAWRVWSTKTLSSATSGKWTVVLVDAEDEILASHMFLALPPNAEGARE